MNLRKNQLVERIEWPENSPVVRITVATLDALMSARYQAHLNQLNSWFLSTTGESLAEIDDWDEPTLKRCAQELNFGVSVAQNLASILTVEVPVPESAEESENEDKPAEWKKIPTPADWLTFDGYLANIDPEMSLLWNEAALRVNPALWDFDESDNGKKKGADSENA